MNVKANIGGPPVTTKYTKEQLTAPDGRLWNEEEVRLMAEWWEAPNRAYLRLCNDLARVIGADWFELEDPPAVDLEREAIRLARMDGTTS